MAKNIKNAIMTVMIFSTPCFSLSMKVKETCRLHFSDLQVQIWNPPGGYVQVESDGNVNFPSTVLEGKTKVIVSQKPPHRHPKAWGTKGMGQLDHSQK